jgi:EmrB/QacA subfamily drug resistance transporter
MAPHTVSWVVNGYVLTFGGLLLLLGRVGDLVGRRRMFVSGSALFTVGTLLAGASGTEWGLLAGRVLQGAGAAALSPTAMALMLTAFPGDQRARAMSLWGAASAVGGATGVLAGGLLAGTIGWSSVFFVTVPVTAAAVLLAPRLLAPDAARGASKRFDVAGAVSVTGAVVALVQSTLHAVDAGWTRPGTVVGFALVAALSAAFVAIERRAEDPLVPLELFRSRALVSGVALAVLGGSVRASTFVLVALFLQRGLDVSPQHAGLAMVPTSLTGFAANLFLLPRVLRAFGPRRSLVAGLVVLAVGQLWLAWAPADAAYVVSVLPGLLLVAAGVALSFTPTTMVITSAVPTTHTGLASGLASSATQVGAALGTALLTTLALTGGTGSPGGFTLAFTSAAVVAVATAVLGRRNDRQAGL